MSPTNLVARATACSLCAAVALGCTGKIGDAAALASSGTPSSAGSLAGSSPSGGNNPTGSGASPAAPIAAADIGFTTSARLNQTQYNNTVHDLLGTNLTPASSFPVDETDLGFDTISSVLRVQPAHIEQYLAAAQTLMAEFFARPPTDPWYTRYVACDYTSAEASCLQQILTGFASKAWRRPATVAELAPYLALAASQSSPQAGLQAAMEAVLVSTKFIYRLELDPNPNDTTIHRLSAYELASRLSYLIWSSMPDDDLFAAAASGSLLTSEGLKAEVARMLAVTAKAQAFIDTFGTQWLGVSELTLITPDPTMFPTFNDAVRQGMMAETTQFLLEFLNDGLPLPQLLTANFTYANAALAAMYGLPAVQGTGSQRVSTVGTPRGGLLTQGTYLAGFSNATSTSPVKRGLYILARLLCSSPAPPPAGVNTNLAEIPNAANLSVRQQLEAHEMLGPTCASCHQVMDPMGLIMENYDAIGQYRTADPFGPIDATGSIPSPPPATGTINVDGEVQLASILATDPRFVPCAIQNVASFGLGRPFASLGGPATDQPILTRLAAATSAGGQSFVAILNGLTQDDVFRSRRAASSSEVAAQGEAMP
jgi:uncharacterized protein DUF1592/uncharacterized protein DUF1588/uncharacterized protein DUF1587/uncharacterized protein DUF1595